jgi:UPF0716 protein FxsA
MARRIAIGLILLTTAEIAAFLLVAWAIGVMGALALMLATSFAGALVLRHAGGREIARIRRALEQGEISAGAAAGGALAVGFGGILLLLPGFVTDILGAGLLLPATRRFLGATIGRAIRGRHPGGEGARDVLDLAPGEWRHVPDERLPRSRSGRDTDP